ncbi:ATP-dependent DNA ligase [Rhizophagus irregularis]|uniref:DNA ligase n=1 Tax=Rhizophagus irregularis TaxID=588596 RepID=A0A2N1NCC1_9GLOM|nr:ATP-dependent DNA ligase [Rhizophagus irregularis]
MSKQTKVSNFFGKPKLNDSIPQEKKDKKSGGKVKKRIIESSDEESNSEVDTKKIKFERENERENKTESSSEMDEDNVKEEQDDNLESELVSTKKLVDQKDMKDVGADWKKGEPVPYAGLCKTFEAIESTTKRLEIQEYLTSFFKHTIELSPGNLLETLYLCLNRVCPEYENVELGIGESLLIKAIAEVTGRTTHKVKNELAKVGDLGKVARDSKNSQKSISSMFGNRDKLLTVPKVFNSMKKIAFLTGHSSQDLKIKEIQNLLISCRDEEPKFLTRSLEGKLRIGLAEQTVLICLAQAFVMTDKEYEKLAKAKKTEELNNAIKTIKSVYSELPSYDKIVPALLKGGIKNLREHCKLTPGIPLKPMLAHPTKSITDVLDSVEGHKFTCEFKYDGERGQIHRLEDGTTKIFSRNLEDNTVKYPDIIERISKAAKTNTKSYVLDCEVVAWDLEKHILLPFQVLSTRKRKDVKEAEIKVSVCLFAFDLLYLNGESLLKKSLEERRKLMNDSFQEIEDEFSFVQNINATNIEEIQSYLDESIKANCEGLMVKILDGLESTYEPSKRSRNWLKLKKDYLSGVGDSLDLVVVGAFYGRGKRTNVYGAFLLACYDPEHEEYQTICKIGTGFSDSDLETHFNYLKEKETSEPKSYFNYDKGTKPDVWFEPCQVWEVKAADLSISPIYKAAIGQISEASKGVSLRFPRFIRIREDKKPEDATTSEQVAELFQNQYNNKE